MRCAFFIDSASEEARDEASASQAGNLARRWRTRGELCQWRHSDRGPERDRQVNDSGGRIPQVGKQPSAAKISTKAVSVQRFSGLFKELKASFPLVDSTIEQGKLISLQTFLNLILSISSSSIKSISRDFISNKYLYYLRYTKM